MLNKNQYIRDVWLCLSVNNDEKYTTGQCLLRRQQSYLWQCFEASKTYMEWCIASEENYIEEEHAETIILLQSNFLKLVSLFNSPSSYDIQVTTNFTHHTSV